jgi:hopene-associated glycosyltransferase HpnB
VIWSLVAALSLAVWLVLLFGRQGFWLTTERDTRDMPAEPGEWPKVVAVVPARDEADVIARSVSSLAAQDYAGPLKIVVVDDSSTDGTGQIARTLGSNRVEVEIGRPLATGWTGKLWAIRQGVERAGSSPRYLWLTDADIEHAPDTLRMLVSRAEAGSLSLVSLMAKLRCESFAERMLIPAFVFFFQMLYPFAQVNRPKGPGGAAGGCMLVRRESLEAAGGIEAIRNSLIDDCALGALLKQRGRIWLGLTERSRSIRRYESFGTIGAMISRSAYAQLGYSPVLLLGTIAGLALVYAAPPLLAVLAHGFPRFAGAASWTLMAIAFQPMLVFYRRSWLWGLALPAIAAFYAGCTLLSAWQYVRGRGGIWKGRVQAAAGR